MCTLACWVGQFPEAPLVVAANRDENLGRASTPPFVWHSSPRIVAPRDDVACGSWWALNEHGIFVGLTNRFGATLDKHRRSRGLLVMELAAARTIDEAEAKLRALRAENYNGFHLLAASGTDAVRAIDTGAELSVERLGPGLHILTERSFGASIVTRDQRVANLFRPLAHRPLDLDAMEEILGTHEDDPFESLCVHLDLMDYGTRSSTVLALGPSIRSLRFANGPPCTTPFERQDHLLEALQFGGA